MSWNYNWSCLIQPAFFFRKKIICLNKGIQPIITWVKGGIWAPHSAAEKARRFQGISQSRILFSQILALLIGSLHYSGDTAKGRWTVKMWGWMIIKFINSKGWHLVFWWMFNDENGMMVYIVCSHDHQMCAGFREKMGKQGSREAWGREIQEVQITSAPAQVPYTGIYNY